MVQSDQKALEIQGMAATYLHYIAREVHAMPLFKQLVGTFDLYVVLPHLVWQFHASTHHASLAFLPVSI